MEKMRANDCSYPDAVVWDKLIGILYVLDTIVFPVETCLESFVEYVTQMLNTKVCLVVQKILINSHVFIITKLNPMSGKGNISRME